ncbi:hypothetical protein D7Y13_00595 [Corallococcus praedator]|uniref:Uncharacterized protein n=1 Tax=Corallococcus praedator TaxID=2316724 RepID=A0ABX9QTL4_9BACT|nr:MULTISPECIES: hypothetical protein [Corallococcus]RKH35910.1 hypothetical protein D7X75_02565 [Corallococcus sp. CA031C]RKI17626.1 hypothetical protein D7Y13_00595 [Corallococcus praedator]
MHDTSSRGPRSPSLFKHLRIPLLLAVGGMTMGSGLGNPGCGSGGVPDCEDGCNVQGTYALVFEEAPPLSQGCTDLGLTLPTELVLERQGNSGYVTGRLLGHGLSGGIYESSNTRLDLSIGTFAPDDTPIIVEVSGRFSAEARTDSQPLTYSGELRFESDDAAKKCQERRLFIGTRQ